MDLTIGPAIEEGFYYDCYMGDRALGEPEKERLNQRIAQVRRLPSSRPALLLSPQSRIRACASGCRTLCGFGCEAEFPFSGRPSERGSVVGPR